MSKNLFLHSFELEKLQSSILMILTNSAPMYQYRHCHWYVFW